MLTFPIFQNIIVLENPEDGSSELALANIRSNVGSDQRQTHREVGTQSHGPGTALGAG